MGPDTQAISLGRESLYSVELSHQLSLALVFKTYRGARTLWGFWVQQGRSKIALGMDSRASRAVSLGIRGMGRPGLGRQGGSDDLF